MKNITSFGGAVVALKIKYTFLQLSAIIAKSQYSYTLHGLNPVKYNWTYN